MTDKHFKAGDRVRCLTVCGGESVAVPGEVYTVTRDTMPGLGLTEFKNDHGAVSAMFAERFDLVPEVVAPVTPKAPAPVMPGTRLDQVLKHLLTGKTLTQGEGIILGYGTRVAATVHTLRQRGHNIVTTMKEDLNGFTYAEYRLVTRRPNGNRKAA